MQKWLLLVGLLYLGILVFLSWYSQRKVKSQEDFIMAGSKLGLILGFMTFSATLFSAFTLMGMPDFSRVHGVGAWMFLAFSDGGMVFLILWFGYLLRKKVANIEFKGMSSLLQQIYGIKWAGYLYFFAIFIFLVPYVAIQIRGVATFLELGFGSLQIPAWLWSLGIVGFVLLYSSAGGLKAIVYADFVQGTSLLIIVWIIGVACLQNMGGWTEMFNQIALKNEALLSTPGPKGLLTSPFLIGSFIAIMMIPVTQPQLSTRLVIMKDIKAMNKMAVAVGFFAMLVIFPTLLIGFYGAINYPDATAAEFIGNALIKDQTPVIGALAVIGLFAAAMSTADSQLFALGNELRGLLSEKARKSLITIRLAVLGFAASALIFSLFSSDQLVLLARVSFAGTAMTGPLILLGLITNKPQGSFMVWLTALGILTFLLAQANILPIKVGGLGIDLWLFILLGLAAFANYLVMKTKE
jgi:SSS family solute:Na+ symporter